jgi:hypothetical protein
MKHKTRKFEMGGPTSYAESGGGGGTEMSFSEAFKAARAVAKRQGRDPDKEPFTWKGKKYKAEMGGGSKESAPSRVTETKTTTEVETPSSDRPRSGGRGSKPGSAKVGTGRYDDPTSTYMDRVLSPFKRLTGGNLFGQREVERVARSAGVSTEEARRRLREAGMNRGGAVKKMNKGGMPDLTGDGKVTRADVLKGRGVFNSGGSVKKMAGGGTAYSSASKRADGIASKGKTRGRII